MSMAIGLIGAAVSVVGTFVAMGAQQEMVAEQTAQSKRAENAREQQMQLDAQRRRRVAVRESMFARATSLSAGVNQGAGDGSGLQGGMAGAVSAGLENQQGINAGQVLGSRVFESNRAYHDATQRGQAGMAFGQGLSALGGALVSNSGTIGQLFQQGGATSGARPFQTPAAPARTTGFGGKTPLGGAPYGFTYAGNS
jgi:hypothetical protein